MGELGASEDSRVVIGGGDDGGSYIDERDILLRTRANGGRCASEFIGGKRRRLCSCLRVHNKQIDRVASQALDQQKCTFHCCASVAAR